MDTQERDTDAFIATATTGDSYISHLDRASLIEHLNAHTGNPLGAYAQGWSIALTSSGKPVEVPDGGDLPVTKEEMSSGIPQRFLICTRANRLMASPQLVAKKNWCRDGQWRGLTLYPTTVQEGIDWLYQEHTYEEAEKQA